MENPTNFWLALSVIVGLLWAVGCTYIYYKYYLPEELLQEERFQKRYRKHLKRKKLNNQ